LLRQLRAVPGSFGAENIGLNPMPLQERADIIQAERVRGQTDLLASRWVDDEAGSERRFSHDVSAISFQRGIQSDNGSGGNRLPAGPCIHGVGLRGTGRERRVTGRRLGAVCRCKGGPSVRLRAVWQPTLDRGALPPCPMQ
jgi:hypothetical protein